MVERIKGMNKQALAYFVLTCEGDALGYLLYREEIRNPRKVQKCQMCGANFRTQHVVYTIFEKGTRGAPDLLRYVVRACSQHGAALTQAMTRFEHNVGTGKKYAKGGHMKHLTELLQEAGITHLSIR